MPRTINAMMVRIMKKNNKNITAEKLGRYLTFVLRHRPQSIGLSVTLQAWADIDTLIHCSALAGVEFTHLELQQVVNEDNKQRFAYNMDQTKIRASQGHSFTVDLQLTNQEPPATLYHGTAERFVDSILQQGLLPQKRHAVHLSTMVATAVAVGSRYGKPVVLKVAAQDMHAAGYTFQCSENGVWLTNTVPVKYIETPSDFSI